MHPLCMSVCYLFILWKRNLCPPRCPLTHSVWWLCTSAGAITLREEAVYCTDRLVFVPQCIVRLLKCWFSALGCGSRKKSFHRSIKFIHFNEFNLKFANKTKACVITYELRWHLQLCWDDSLNFSQFKLILSVSSLMGSMWWAAHWTRR